MVWSRQNFIMVVATSLMAIISVSFTIPCSVIFIIIIWIIRIPQRTSLRTGRTIDMLYYYILGDISPRLLVLITDRGFFWSTRMIIDGIMN